MQLYSHRIALAIPNPCGNTQKNTALHDKPLPLLMNGQVVV